MSAVVAVCGSNYVLMSGDTRLVSYENGVVTKIISEDTRKVFRLNDNTLMGLTGDYRGWKHLVDNIVKRDNSAFDMPKISQDVYDCVRSFQLGGLPCNIFIGGKGKDGGFVIAEMTSNDGFKPKAYPAGATSHQVRCGLPTIDDPGATQQINDRIARLSRSKTLDEMRSRVENLIKNIAQKNDTVNSTVYSEWLV
jgi:hypothetical protein